MMKKWTRVHIVKGAAIVMIVCAATSQGASSSSDAPSIRLARWEEPAGCESVPFRLGDEGSGFSIGRKGLNAVSKQFDGRGNFTLISKYLEDKFEIDSAEKLIAEAYKNNFDIASVAPLVINAAENNDEAAVNILLEEIREILRFIQVMQQKLNLAEFKLSLIGSLINKENFYSGKLREKIMNHFPGIKIQLPQNPPVAGAILMAKRITAGIQK